MLFVLGNSATSVREFDTELSQNHRMRVDREPWELYLEPHGAGTRSIACYPLEL
jgi:hypothetical protein